MDVGFGWFSYLMILIGILSIRLDIGYGVNFIKIRRAILRRIYSRDISE